MSTKLKVNEVLLFNVALRFLRFREDPNSVLLWQQAVGANRYLVNANMPVLVSLLNTQRTVFILELLPFFCGEKIFASILLSAISSSITW